MWFRGSRRKTYSATGGFLVTASASIVARIAYSSTLIHLNTPPHTHSCAWTHTLQCLDTCTQRHTHAEPYARSQGHTCTLGHVASSPPTLSAAATFSLLHLCTHAIVAVTPRTPHRTSPAWNRLFHLSSDQSHAYFMSCFKGHLLQSRSLAPWATWGPLAIAPVVHRCTPL